MTDRRLTEPTMTDSAALLAMLRHGDSAFPGGGASFSCRRFRSKFTLRPSSFAPREASRSSRRWRCRCRVFPPGRTSRC